MHMENTPSKINLSLISFKKKNNSSNFQGE